MASTEITDLEELVKTWAWDTFLRVRSKEQEKVPFEDVTLEVNWSQVKFNSLKPEFFDQGFAGQPQTQVVYRSTYENHTSNQQHHNPHGDGTIMASCTTSISKGFTKGIDLGVKLGVPDEVAGETAMFAQGVTMTSTEESTHQESQQWHMFDGLQIRHHHRVVAELVIDNKVFNAKFRVPVQIKGQVTVVVTSLQDDNAFAKTIKGDFSEIMKTMGEKVDKDVVIDKRLVTWNLEGACQFKFGVDHRVRAREFSLNSQ